MKARILNMWYENKDGETTLILRLKPEKGPNYILEVGGTESDFYIPDGEMIPEDNRILRYEDGPLSIFRDLTKRIVARYPGDVRDMKELYVLSEKNPAGIWSQTWQADIIRTLKSMIEYDIYDGVEVPTGLTRCHIDDVKPCDCSHIPIEKCRFDIEATAGAGQFPDPRRKTNEVISISIEYVGEGIVWFQRKGDPGEKDPVPSNNDYTIRIFDNEQQLLVDFFTWLQTEDPDILEAWSNKFDVDYLNTRINIRYKNTLKDQYGQKSHRTQKTQLLNIQVFDVYRAYAQVGTSPSNRLKFVIKHEGLVEETVSDVYEGKWWGTENSLLCYYNFMDSVYVRMIDEKKGVFDFFWGLKRTVGLPAIDDTFFNSRIIDALLMRMDKGVYVYPTKVDHTGEGYEGAIVFEPVPGYYQEGVAIMDFSRAYPTFMIKHNLSPEVFVLGIKEEGCLPRLCRVLLEEREKHEAVMDEIFQCEGPECDAYKTAKLKRDVVKYLLNAVYGVTGSTFFRMFHPDVAATVTKIGREALLELKRKAEELGYEVIYGDTDSVFVVCPSVEEGIKIAQILEDHINIWFDNLKVTPEWVREEAVA